MSTSSFPRPTRRQFLALLAAAGGTAGLAVAGCGNPGPSAPGGAPAAAGGGLTMWALNDQSVLEASVEAYNADNPDAPIALQLFANDDYKQRLRIAFGAGEAPDIFFSWGGGALADYVRAGQVAPVPASVDTSRFTPSVLATATVDGAVHGVPCNGLAPVVLYYNRTVLDGAGVAPPTTFDELLAAVGTLSGQGITPISLAAASKWPTLMWEAYLVDRVGGADLFSAIADGDAAGWTDPAVTEANRLLQQLVQAGAFGDAASSVAYDQGASTALLYTGRAAMQLMGTWEYANLLTAAPDFVSGGELGWTAFPAVEGGAGDPAAIMGNPSNFLSINAGAPPERQDAAARYLADYVLNDDQVTQFLDNGTVAPVQGLDTTLASSTSPDREWLQFVYDLVQDAPTFQLSWDQALPSEAADPLLSAVDQVFLGQIGPEAFGTTMSQVTGS